MQENHGPLELEWELNRRIQKRRRMTEVGYRMCLREEHPLPNGKKLVRLDFVR